MSRRFESPSRAQVETEITICVDVASNLNHTMPSANNNELENNPTDMSSASSFYDLSEAQSLDLECPPFIQGQFPSISVPVFPDQFEGLDVRVGEYPQPRAHNLSYFAYVPDFPQILNEVEAAHQLSDFQQEDLYSPLPENVEVFTPVLHNLTFAYYPKDYQPHSMQQIQGEYDIPGTDSASGNTVPTFGQESTYQAADPSTWPVTTPQEEGHNESTSQ